MPGMVHATLRATLRSGVLLAGLLTVQSAGAEPGVPRLTYATYIGGLNVFDLGATLAISAQGYRLQMSYRLTGVVGAVVHGEGMTTVDGRFQAGAAVPRQLFSSGSFRGRPYVTQLDWQAGRPVITRSDPPEETEREPVPLEQQLHTIDALSALASLLNQVATTGRCDGALHTYDGRRLSEFAARTVGEESLPETDRSSFKGTALRCDFDGRMIGGFSLDSDKAEMQRIQHGSAWFARVVPGDPPVPVRITFGARSFGEATMYLTGQS